MIFVINPYFVEDGSFHEKTSAEEHKLPHALLYLSCLLSTWADDGCWCYFRPYASTVYATLVA